MRGLSLRRNARPEFENTATSIQTGLGITNKDLLNNLNRQSSVSPVGDNLASPRIVSDVDAFLGAINRPAPDITASDIFTPTSPVTQAGYHGETFSMPTFAGESVTFPFHILSKRAQARREQREEQQIQALQFDKEQTQLSDEIRNEIFLNKREDSFKGKLDEIQAAMGFGATRAQASKFMQDSGITRQMTSQWNNLASLYNKTYENYLKVLSDTDALGRSKYDEKTKRLAAQFDDFISNIDDFDPHKLDEYAQFYNKFNESVSISDLAKRASEEMKGIAKEDADEAAGLVWQMYGEGAEFTPEQEQTFKSALKFYFDDKLGDREKLKLTGDAAVSLESLKEQNREKLEKQKQAAEIETIEKRGEEARILEEQKQAGREKLKEIGEEAKPEKRITISDQAISVTDPMTGTSATIDAKNVITFPELAKKATTVPGKNVFIEDKGWVTINEAVEIKPLREFKATVRNDLIGKTSGEVMITEKGQIPGYFGKGDKYKEQTFIQAEINAAGTRRGEDYEEIEQDVVKAKDSAGKAIEIRGKETVIIPKDNISDKLINLYGKNYEKAQVKEKGEEKLELSVAAYNKSRKPPAKNYTKAQLEEKFGDQYTIVD